MKLWLDDCRSAPPGWIWVRDEAEFRTLVRDNVAEIEAVEFDFYLEDGDSLGCVELLRQACESAKIEHPSWGVHSASAPANAVLTKTLQANAALVNARARAAARPPRLRHPRPGDDSRPPRAS